MATWDKPPKDVGDVVGGIKPPTLEEQLTGSQRDAFAAISSRFAQYGLGTLAPKIIGYLKDGFSADTISILLQDTSEYKQRFAGNEVRKQKGLPVLSPAEYLSTESSYRQLMRQAGLPAGFYDQNSDFTQFIGKDVSPTELKQRVDLAASATTLASPQLKQALSGMYGLDDSSITAYLLDPERAIPHIQKQVAAAQIGAEALKRGLQVSGKAEDYATSGVTAQQAAQAYGQIAQQLPGFQAAASSFGTGINQDILEQAYLGPVSNPEAEGTVTRLASWNRARAQGQASGARAGLVRSTSGRV